MFGFAPDPLGIDNVRSVHGRAGVDQIIVPAGTVGEVQVVAMS